MRGSVLRACTGRAVFQIIASALPSRAVILCLLALPAHAADRGFNAYDGDTFRATFRIANVDSPEIDGKCDFERRLAIQARDFTRAWLAKGAVTISQDHKRGVDPYGRILVLVSRNGEDLGELLIAKGLARRWDGKRHPWC